MKEYTIPRFLDFLIGVDVNLHSGMTSLMLMVGLTREVFNCSLPWEIPFGTIRCNGQTIQGAWRIVPFKGEYFTYYWNI